MVDSESVHRRLREIDKRLVLLRELREAGRDAFKQDVHRQAEAERHLQLAIQAALDICGHIVAESSAEVPEDYRTCFGALAKLQVLDDDLAQRLGLAAGLRNILVHAYLEIDPAQIWSHIDDLDDLEAFSRAVLAHLGGPG
ncbi:MAG: DUF86 domain-containing protein [Actinomycetota bacterium]